MSQLVSLILLQLTVICETIEIADVKVLTPALFEDDRGVFFEWFKSSEISGITGSEFFVRQANCSVSQKGVIRGIHFAKNPPGQKKYVTCFSGSALDLVVDFRPKSETFGKWNFVELSSNNRNIISIPNGIGHGFIALEDNTTIAYLCDQPYRPENEFAINPFDETLQINWPKGFNYVVSDKDTAAPGFLQMKNFLQEIF